MKLREKNPVAHATRLALQQRLPEAIERLVQLYEATDRKDEAAKWRKELEGAKAAQKKP